MTVTLRDRSADDDSFLRELFASTREAELTALPPELAQTFVDQQFAAQTDHYRSTYPNAVDRIVCRGPEPIGRLLIERGTDEIRVVDIAIVPGEQGRGVGTKLLVYLCDEADGRGVPLYLSVAEGNPVKNLYERLGFLTQRSDGIYSAMARRPSGRS